MLGLIVFPIVLVCWFILMVVGTHITTKEEKKDDTNI